MKLFVFPSARALAVMALRNHLQIDCEIEAVDLGRGDQRTPEYAARNPNLKMPMLEDDGFVLWESMRSCSTWRTKTRRADFGHRA